MQKLNKILLISNMAVVLLALQVLIYFSDEGIRPVLAEEAKISHVDQTKEEIQRKVFKMREELEHKKAAMQSKTNSVRQDVEKRKEEIRQRISELKNQSFEGLESRFDLIDEGLEFRFNDITFAESGFEAQFRPVETTETSNDAIAKIHGVLMDLKYDEPTSLSLAKTLLPLYERLHFTDTNDTQAIINDLEKNRRLIHSYVFNLGGGIDPKQFNTIVLLTDDDLGGFMRDIVNQLDSLTAQQKASVHTVFLCNYTSYIGWIMLKAKGLDPEAILTDNIPDELNQQTRPWWEQLTKSYNLQGLPENMYHAALTLKLPNGQHIFVDFVNNFLSQPYALEEDYFQSFKGWHVLTSHDRKDIFKKFDLVDRSNFRAVLYDMVGNVHRDFGRYDASMQCSNQALTISPALFMPHLNLGFKYADLKKYSLAIEHFQKAIELNPYDVLVHKAIGYSYYEVNQYKEAINELNNYMNASSQVDDNTVVLLAGCYFSLRQFQEALANFAKAIQLNANNGHAHYYLGLTYMELNQDSLAKNSFEKALRIFNRENDVDMVASTKEILDNHLKFVF